MARDRRPVIADGRRKSIGAETTFERDLLEWDEAVAAITPLFPKVWAAYAKGEPVARTLTVKVKYADFHQITPKPFCFDSIVRRADMEALAFELLRPLFPPPLGVRLLGITLSNFDDPGIAVARQLALALA